MKYQRPCILDAGVHLDVLIVANVRGDVIGTDVLIISHLPVDMPCHKRSYDVPVISVYVCVLHYF